MFGSIIFLILGCVIIYYSAGLVELTGRITWAENNLGGTRQMYVLGGVLSLFVGFLLMFGVVGSASDTVNDSTDLQLNGANNQMIVK